MSGINHDIGNIAPFVPVSTSAAKPTMELRWSADVLEQKYEVVSWDSAGSERRTFDWRPVPRFDWKEARTLNPKGGETDV